MEAEARVLQELSREGYVSGEAISRKLKISRSAVWKHIVKLRERGYEIEASPRRGYRLTGRPDKLLAAEFVGLTKARVVGKRISHHETATSTADVARRLIGERSPEGTVVIAEAQTGGRGRMGRRWLTPRGQAIAMSVILYPKLDPGAIPLLGLGTALAVMRAVEPFVALCAEAPEVAVKWPNDIYLGGKKLGGVLVEMAAELDRAKWVIDSIGLNVNNSFKGTSLEDQATSLKEECGREFSRRELAAALFDQLDEVYASVGTGDGLKRIASRFARRDMLQGKRVTVTTPAGVTRGVATGIDAGGRLLVRQPGGEVRALFSGEATLEGTFLS